MDTLRRRRVGTVSLIDDGGVVGAMGAMGDPRAGSSASPLRSDREASSSVFLRLIVGWERRWRRNEFIVPVVVGES